MQVSIDLVLIVINLLALAFCFGKFSEKISQIEVKLAEISDNLTRLNSEYYTAKDGQRLEDSLKAMWSKFDTHRCTTCTNFNEGENHK